jgi:aminopeptidase N
MDTGERYVLHVSFKGKPRQAARPPWDGGFIWGKDSMGKPWIAVACQGLGASAWWPCKDYQSDEPDGGMTLTFHHIPQGLTCVSNGRMQAAITAEKNDGSVSWTVKNPINTYDASFYIGDYVHWSDTLMGEKGKLDLDFYALRYNEAKARKQFAVTKQMLHCFEYWMGPYPFYEDGYKLVEAPYLGMEHQSAVAYGNEYKMGYMGRDRSNTGEGLKFDFIIVHESGHEWFGNNITARDIADNWIHEGFTTYTEGLFAECLLGREKAFDYIRGEWHNIRNDNPVIGPYNVNAEGSSDMYDKGSAVVHMMRMLMADDAKFRSLLRSLNEHFYHKTVTEAEFETYINAFTGMDFTPLFNQYLRTAMVPVMEYYMKKGELYYRFTHTVPGFTLPVNWQSTRATPALHPTDAWQHTKWKKSWTKQFRNDFLVEYKELEAQ